MRNALLQFATAGLLSLSIGGCMASGQVHSSASISAPDLVYIGPSVQVIADWNEPVFYSSSYYWRYDGGAWYRSSDYQSGWVRIQTVPVEIQQIQQPTAYIHYHAQASANANASAQPGPTMAPHDERDAAHERRDERQDVKEERKEDQKERKEDQKDERKADHDEGKGHKPKGH